MKILLIEDEQAIADFVAPGLSARGFEVQHCTDGNDGLAQALMGGHAAIVLDIMLPGLDGLSILTALRRESVKTPVVLLTARNELGDRIQGLELGADDYLAKPFYVEELAARIHALLRRVNGEHPDAELRAGRLRLDRITREVRCGAEHVELTGREFSLLAYLMRTPGQVYTRGQILEHVWGYDFDPNTNVVDVCIKRIRGKLASIDALGDGAGLIESVRGSGYRLRPLP